MFREQVNEWEKLNQAHGASTLAARQFARAVRADGRMIPDDFREFLAETNGCELDYKMGVADVDYGISLYGFRPAMLDLSPEADALSDWRSIGLPIEDFLQIGAGYSGIFVMRVQGQNVGEILWWSSDAEQVVKVADSFTEFFQRIAPESNSDGTD
jgi:SMI1-KNR4 cell-wall